MKIVNAGKSTSSPSRLDTTIEDRASSNLNQPSSIDTSMSQQEIQALMTIDIPELKDNLMHTKETLANGNTEALTSITDIENQLLLLQHNPSFIGDLQSIKDYIAKEDLKKALQDISQVQTKVIKAETEIFASQLDNPDQSSSQQDNNNDKEDDEDN